MSELHWLDGIGQAELIRTRKISPRELVEHSIARIEKLNPGLNAVIVDLFERALEEAEGGRDSSPFIGVPMLLKDLLAEYGGTSLSEGSAFLKGRFSSEKDSELVARYRRAGLIVMGKTNTPEFGLMGTTEPRAWGATRNPWDRERSPGGSSGGSAAAVASGMVPIAHANDGGGSIRIPAACCGLFGLKPSRGRNPLGHAYGDVMGGLISEHVVTRSVRDSAMVLDVTGRPDRGDPYRAPERKRTYLEELFDDRRGLLIAYSATSPVGTPVHEDCKQAVEKAARLCADLGHDVEEAALPVDMDKLRRTFATYWTTLAGWSIEDWARRSGQSPSEEMFEPSTWEYYRRSKNITAADYLMAVQDAQNMAREIGSFFRQYDMWLSPTLGEPAPFLGQLSAQPADDVMQGIRQGAVFAPFTAIFNLTGQPAMNVPLFWNEQGLPVGVQFAGRFGDEAMLFRLAAQLERARPWADRYHDIAA